MARFARLPLLLAALILAGPSTSRAGEDAVWHTDYREAVSLATRLRRPLLLFFTGSDWCDRCRELRSEVFDTPEFAAWARRTVVLVEVDFPRHRTLEAGLKRQNDDLARRFSDSVGGGYPTVLLLDPGGTRTIAELGYQEGGPVPWTDAADQALARGPEAAR